MYDILEKLCIERGITITKLCTDVTGSSGNLSTWKKGYMRSDYLRKAADILNVSADYLLNRPEYYKNNIDNEIPAKPDEPVELDNTSVQMAEMFQALPIQDKGKVITFVYQLAEEGQKQ